MYMRDTDGLRDKGTLCAGCGFYLGLHVQHEAYCDDCAEREDVPEELSAKWLRMNQWKLNTA